MNKTPTSRAPAPPARQAGAASRILVWDAPIRVFHWLMVLCFAGAYLSAENDSLRLLHVTLGYTMAGLVAFRLVWGFAGSRYARFSQFVRGPHAVLGYLRSVFAGHPEHHVGHTPTGALAIIALLVSTVLLVATGWANYHEIGGEWTEELHEGIANIMLALVLLHVAAVVATSWLHRENLVGAMFHGYKQGPAGQGIGKLWRGMAVLMLAAVLGFWWWQWQAAPAGPGDGRPAAGEQRDAGHRD